MHDDGKGWENVHSTEQDRKIRALETRIDRLEQQIRELEIRLERLER